MLASYAHTEPVIARAQSGHVVCGMQNAAAYDLIGHRLFNSNDCGVEHTLGSL